MSSSDQSHPLYAQDRQIIDGLLAQQQPDSAAITNAGRLFIRYSGFPGAKDIKRDLSACLVKWGLSRDELNAQCFKIWNSGYRPGQSTDEITVGSGADSDD